MGLIDRGCYGICQEARISKVRGRVEIVTILHIVGGVIRPCNSIFDENYFFINL